MVVSQMGFHNIEATAQSVYASTQIIDGRSYTVAIRCATEQFGVITFLVAGNRTDEPGVVLQLFEAVWEGKPLLKTTKE